MASPAEQTWSDWVQLNYVNIENKRIKPITVRIPKEVLDLHPDPIAPPITAIMMSRLRRSFDEARSKGKARFARNSNQG